MVTQPSTSDNGDDLVGRMMEFESGDLNDADTLGLFSDLVKSGTIGGLQGSYGRFASFLIANDFLTAEGEITDHARETMGMP